MGGAWSNVPGVSMSGGITLEEVLVNLRIRAAMQAAANVPSVHLTDLQQAYLVNK